MGFFVGFLVGFFVGFFVGFLVGVAAFLVVAAVDSLVVSSVSSPDSEGLVAFVATVVSPVWLSEAAEALAASFAFNDRQRGQCHRGALAPRKPG